MDFNKTVIETIRWNILQALDVARPYGTNENVILSALQAEHKGITQLIVRRELDYLEDRKLAEITNQHTGTWFAELTRYGVDIAEYTVECKPGIARPEKYW